MSLINTRVDLSYILIIETHGGNKNVCRPDHSIIFSSGAKMTVNLIETGKTKTDK